MCRPSCSAVYESPATLSPVAKSDSARSRIRVSAAREAVRWARSAASSASRPGVASRSVAGTVNSDGSTEARSRIRGGWPAPGAGTSAAVHAHRGRRAALHATGAPAGRANQFPGGCRFARPASALRILLSPEVRGMEWEILMTGQVEEFLDQLYVLDRDSHRLVNQAILVLERNGPPRVGPSSTASPPRVSAISRSCGPRQRGAPRSGFCSSSILGVRRCCWSPVTSPGSGHAGTGRPYRRRSSCTTRT